LIKPGRLSVLPFEFPDLFAWLQANASKTMGQPSSKRFWRPSVAFQCRVAKHLPNELFGANPILFRQGLQPRMDFRLYVSNDELCHMLSL
jgi:hypothetical protein